MQLPEQAQTVYSDWWKFVSYAAAARDESGSFSFTATDLNTAVRDIAAQEGRQLNFQNFTGLAQLFGIARTIERSGDQLTNTADDQRITDGMVAQAPWARSAGVQTAQPEWQLRAQITYRTADGLVITDWGTGVFKVNLPSTVGAMKAEAQLQFARMLQRRTEGRNTGGELLSIDTFQLLQV